MMRSDELNIGDIVQPRRSPNHYRVDSFSFARGEKICDVLLVSLDGKVWLDRTLEQVMDKWLMVRRAPAPQEEPSDG